ncbi:MAG: molybdopterin-dependent oxidoreductase [Anaerolineales bacterium]|nr:molybdopterin-dependent oxidoreductase [Anaerolineales bacterium]
MKQTKVSRRDFLKFSGATGTAATFLATNAGVLKGLAKSDNIPASQTDVQVIPGKCFECHVQCMNLSHIRDGRVVKVEGFPEYVNRGALCAKGQSTIKNLYSPERLNYPLKRTNPKGDPDPGWVRISWDEALDTIAENLLAIKEKYGAPSVAIGQGTGRYSNSQNRRLRNSLDSTNCLGPSHVCRGPMAATTCLTVGHHLRGDFGNSKCQVFWGRNESWGHASFNGPAIMDNLIERKSKLLVVDPRFNHPLAAKADVFLPVRPGSDGALFLSFMQVIFDEGLYDEEAIKDNTNGPFLVRTDNMELLKEGDVVPDGDSRDFLDYPECIEDRANRPTLMIWDTRSESAQAVETPGVEPALFGTYTVEGIECKTALQILKERADEFPPEKAAEVCWTGSADKIRDAARIYAMSESAATDVGSFGYQGIEGGHTNTFQTIRAELCMAAITGNINIPGGEMGHPDWMWIEGRWKREGGPREMTPWGAPDDHLDYVIEGPCPEEPAMNEFPLQPGMSHMSDAFRAMATGEPYPIKAYMMIQGNPLGGWAEDQKVVYEGLKSLEFLADMDLYITPTGNLADILLPAGLGPWERGKDKLLGPQFERWGDEKAYVELGRRVNPEWWFWQSEEEWYGWEEGVVGKNIGMAAEAGYEIFRGAPAPPWDFNKKIDPKTGKQVGFPTSTGRIEIYSVLTKQKGFDPIPNYVEPAQSPYGSPDLAKEYPLVLATGARLPVYYHSQHRANPLQRELFPHPEVDIHPQDAAKAGVEHGDWVWIETKTGKIRNKANVTQGINPGVVSLPHGWWQGCRELGLPGYGWDGANANVLIASDAHDPALGVPGTRSQLCKIYKADEAPYVWDAPYYGTSQPAEYSAPEIYPLKPGQEG